MISKIYFYNSLGQILGSSIDKLLIKLCKIIISLMKLII